MEAQNQEPEITKRPSSSSNSIEETKPPDGLTINPRFLNGLQERKQEAPFNPEARARAIRHPASWNPEARVNEGIKWDYVLPDEEELFLSQGVKGLFYGCEFGRSCWREEEEFWEFEEAEAVYDGGWIRDERVVDGMIGSGILGIFVKFVYFLIGFRFYFVAYLMFDLLQWNS